LISPKPLTDMYPTIPELGSLPYELQDAERRLQETFAWAETRSLTEAVRVVYENEGARLRDLVAQCQKTINRINGGTPAKSDSVTMVKSLLSAINSGIDGLNTLVGNGTALDYAKSLLNDSVEEIGDAYHTVKEEVTSTANELISGNAPWLIIILGLVLAIVFFVKK
jgi:hypothetical protein